MAPKTQTPRSLIFEVDWLLGKFEKGNPSVSLSGPSQRALVTLLNHPGVRAIAAELDRKAGV